MRSRTVRARTARLLGPESLDIAMADLAPPGPGEVLVAIRVALTDGTDLKAYRRGHPLFPTPARFGHEFSGDIIATGAGTQFSPGDAIACVHTAPCGTCYWCERGEDELCASLISTMLRGAYATHVLVPAHIVAKNAFHKPAHVSYEAAAFLEPLACVLHAWKHLPKRPDALVAIIGNGGFGLLHAMIARAFGIAEPMLIGRNPARNAFARSLGFRNVVDTLDIEPLAAIGTASDGRGADIVIECTGSRTVWEQAPILARRGGHVVLFGGLPAGDMVSFDPSRLHYDEVHIHSPFHLTPASVRAAFTLLEKKQLDPTPLITERLALDDLDYAFRELAAGHGIKYAILPDKE